MLERRPTSCSDGEAPGYRGMTVTGIPFTNKALITGNDPFGMFGPDNGGADAPGGADRAGRTHRHGDVERAGRAWTSCRCCGAPIRSIPTSPGGRGFNRTPSAPEIAAGTIFWQDLARLFGIESVVAVGNIGHRSVTASGLQVPKIRHPAHGGKELFRQGLQDLLDAGVIRRSQ